MTGKQMLQHVASILAERGAAYGDAATSMARRRSALVDPRHASAGRVVPDRSEARAPHVQSEAPGLGV